MKRAAGRRHAFDGKDVGAGRLDREHSAGFDGFAVEIDRTGAAMAGVAADVRPREIQLLAQEMDEQGARLDQCLDGLAVDRERDLDLGHGTSPVQLARARARTSARDTITPAILVR